LEGLWLGLLEGLWLGLLEGVGLGLVCGVVGYAANIDFYFATRSIKRHEGEHISWNTPVNSGD
jgi:hypothetical protein